MMNLPFENTEQAIEAKGVQTEKDTMLDVLFSDALHAEVKTAREAGYDITIGETEDAAYESPEKIVEIFDRLKLSGEQFERASRRRALASGSVALALEYSQIPQLNAVRRRLRGHREALRGELLYDLADVQAQAWHDQNGKALALATIADAHGLRTVGGEEGEYDTMSGRLGDDLTYDFMFPVNGVSDNLAGKRLHDAVYENKRAFRGKRSVASSDASAAQDLRKLDDFVQAPVHEGFKDIVAYCTDSLGIRSRKEEVRTEINRHIDASEKESFLMMSVGCGTALPMLEVMQDIQAKGREAKMILLDQDPIALAAAYQFASQMGLQDNVEIHCSQLFVGNGMKTRLMELDDILEGRKLDVCEDSGLREIGRAHV